MNFWKQAARIFWDRARASVKRQCELRVELELERRSPRQQGSEDREMKENVFVLTRDQLIEAVVIGAQATGVFSEALADRFKKSLATVEFQQVRNGALVVLNEFPDATAIEVDAGGEKPAAKPALAKPVTNGNGAAVDEGPDVEKVKEALSAVLARPPSVTTIRAWDGKQRRKAIKWAKEVAKDASAPRPDFIVERAARGSRAASSTPPPAGASGGASSQGGKAAESPVPNPTKRTTSAIDDEPDDEPDKSRFFDDDTDDDETES